MITLRKLETADATKLSNILNSEKVHQYLLGLMPLPFTPADALTLINSENADPENVYSFGIFCDDELIGRICIKREAGKCGCAGELSYEIGENYWGHGYTTEAVKLIKNWIFEHTDMVRIDAWIFSPNAASRRVLLKSGFTLDGKFDCAVVLNGKYESTECYGCVKKMQA
jgi:RimJ/RimL family protein N-acetyltransferase